MLPMLFTKAVAGRAGSFRPVTLVADDMLNCARTMFMREKALGTRRRRFWHGNNNEESAGERGT